MIGRRAEQGRKAVTLPYGAAGTLRRVAAIVVALAALSAPAGAQTSLRHWTCFPIEELDTFDVQESTHLLNNFRLRESKDVWSGQPIIEVSFSAINRADSPLHLSAQFLALGGRAGNPPVVAISAKPDFGIVRAQDTAQVKASVGVTAGEIGNIGTLCARFAS